MNTQEVISERERVRAAMAPFRPGDRVEVVTRTLGKDHRQAHHLDKVTLWRRPGPHARQINLWWQHHKDDQWYKDQRRAEVHSVVHVGTQATVVSFLVCPDNGQRWVGLLLDGGAGLAWCYAIDAFRRVL